MLPSNKFQIKIRLLLTPTKGILQISSLLDNEPVCYATEMVFLTYMHLFTGGKQCESEFMHQVIRCQSSKIRFMF